MCLAIPGRIRSITTKEPGFPVAEVEFGPLVRSAHLLYVPEAKVGDYVIVQAGYAVRTVSETEAREALAAADELVQRLAASSPGS
jgi:hydrogenase expression/formation protein HypC